MLVVLGKKGIRTLDDLGDLATDELVAKSSGVLKDFGLGEDEGNRIIMAARAHWFDDDSSTAGEDAPADGTR
jgi:N utilization substance protein A